MAAIIRFFSAHRRSFSPAAPASTKLPKPAATSKVRTALSAGKRCIVAERRIDKAPEFGGALTGCRVKQMHRSAWRFEIGQQSHQFAISQRRLKKVFGAKDNAKPVKRRRQQRLALVDLQTAGDGDLVKGGVLAELPFAIGRA